MIFIKNLNTGIKMPGQKWHVIFINNLKNGLKTQPEMACDIHSNEDFHGKCFSYKACDYMTYLV